MGHLQQPNRLRAPTRLADLLNPSTAICIRSHRPVLSADVYKVLATPAGVYRAFKKLDAIKANVVWWEAGGQPPQLLADGAVAITFGFNGRFYTAITKDKKPFAIVWDQRGLDWDWWSIPKDGPELDQAYSFIAFASRADRLADVTNYISYGPTDRDAVPRSILMSSCNCPWHRTT